MPKDNPRRRTGRGPETSRGAQRATGPEASKITTGGAKEPRALQFTRLNWLLLGMGALLIVSGYLALASGSPTMSTVVAPVLLVAAYTVLIPLGLIL